MKKIERQAVIFIHGMGEQRPADTLREFVAGVKWQMEQNDASERDIAYRSKVDSIGGLYESIRISLESNYRAGRPITDFYEFYWAHNMRGTTFGNMWIWLTHIFFKKPSLVPRHLRNIWWTFQIVLWGSCLTIFCLSMFLDIQTGLKVVLSFLGGTVLSFIIGLISTWIKSSFLNSLGDVARYFTPVPANISERSAIRQQGIKFLKRLHSIKNDGKVERIIIVAHSLGSAVAYDLIRILWGQYSKIYGELPNDKQPALQGVDDYARDPSSIDHAQDNFAKAQYACWEEFRGMKSPWLITDFITIGAALNALDYFMVTKVPVHRLIEQQELPVCPPVVDAKKKSIYYRAKKQVPGLKRKKGYDVAHAAAPFAVTRWTNIYFRSDFIGGDMSRVFGKGVKDIAIPRKSIWIYPGGHSDYWKARNQNKALVALVDALKL